MHLIALQRLVLPLLVEADVIDVIEADVTSLAVVADVIEADAIVLMVEADVTDVTDLAVDAVVETVLTL
jgi:hypothetical protein